jgi:hypothetical protein
VVKLTLAEKETHFNMTADDRSIYHIYSDDEVMMRKLESIGAKLVKTEAHGGKHYTLPASQISLRKPRAPMSEAQKAKLSRQLAKARAASVITGAENVRQPVG